MTDTVTTEWDEDEGEWVDVLPDDDDDAMGDALIPWGGDDSEA